MIRRVPFPTPATLAALAAAGIAASVAFTARHALAQEGDADAGEASAPIAADGSVHVKTGPAPIRAVTVYPSGALVTRRAQVQVPAGASVVEIDDLTPTLDEASLRARVSTAGVKVTGVSADWQASVEPPREAVARLEAQIEKISHDMQAEQDVQQSLNARRQVLDQYRALSKEAMAEAAGSPAGTAKPEAKWTPALAFVTKEQETISAGLRSSQKRLEKLQEELNAANSELAKIRAGADRRARKVEIELEADAATKADLSLDYTVADAYWGAAYDARNEGKKLDVTCFGTVTQGSGEDWSGVSLTLSTSRPAESAQVPEIRVAMLSGHARRKQPVQIVSYGKKQEKNYQEGGETQGALGGDGRVAIDDHGTGVTFRIKGQETVPADRRPHKVEIADLPLDATVGWEAIPKIAPFVYLKATAKNSAKFPLLAGPVDVFRSSGYIGTGRLDYVAPGEEFSVSLGSDDDLKVRRVIDERVDTKPKLLGSTRSLAYGYSIDLSNYKDSPETITLVENIPVTQRKEITVNLRDGSTKPDLKDDEGFLKWKVPLKPGETKTVYFGYTVEYPKDFQIGGL